MLFNEIFNEKIIPNKKGFFSLEFTENIIVIIICIILIYYSYKLILNSNNKITIIFIFIISIYLILIYINHKLKTNKNFSKNKKELNEIKLQLNTGDIVLFRSYYSDKFSDIFIYKAFLPIIQETFITHIGIIYKDSFDNVYILESNGDKFYCDLTKKTKNGPLVIDINKRFDNLENYRIHIVKTNLYKFIDIKKLNESIMKYKEYSFMHDGIYCVNYILKILEENNLYKINNMFPVPNDILNKNNYLCDIIFEESIIIKDIINTP